MTANVRSFRPDVEKMRTIEMATRVDQQLAESDGWYSQSVLKLKRQFLPYYFMAPPIWRIALRSKLSKERVAPSFVSVGAVRSGTSLLSDYIMQHPCVMLPLAKEIAFSPFLQKEMILAQFPTERERRDIEAKYGKAITGYCTPAMPHAAFPYLLSGLVSSSEVKFVVILRNPADRAFAHWRWDSVLLRKARRDSLWRHVPDFGEIIRLELEYMQSRAAGMPTISGIASGGYIQHSIYPPFLRALFRMFDRKRVLIVKAEDFFSEPRRIAKSVYSFLGLPDFEPVDMPVRNAGPPGKMDDATRQLLNDFFAPLNQELREVTGTDIDWS